MKFLDRFSKHRFSETEAYLVVDTINDSSIEPDEVKSRRLGVTSEKIGSRELENGWNTTTISILHACIANVAQEHVCSVFVGTICTLIGLLFNVEQGSRLHSLLLLVNSAPQLSPAASMQVQDDVPSHTRQRGVARPLH